ncbi:FAD/NAD(P)-binding oxidoreductase [Aureispira sp. CCB-E]|uniref:NAD(P)/FAD-dependent oxidoreductase n=1 Tax=Aureispira sp. CCB-E TaxID=3051121 RepID=UPI002868BE31|nr:FAD/NAD(P)-binding oxidoreductase [Aureispira sp. CCB-E]WMX15082.1 FAD/NAD(P)-binding oxidoreductase [Aureispira sp. CCB-E]
MATDNEHVVIIGNGISGVTAARFIRKLSDKKITIISGETKYFFSRTALMYIYMGHMKFENTQPYEPWFWEKNRIDLVFDYVDEVNTQAKTLKMRQGETINYDKLIIACGSTPNKFGWPGQDLDAVQGLYSYQDLEGMEKYSKDLERAVIVGGGLIGLEMAEMFQSRNIPVTFLVREKSYWDAVMPKEESLMIGRHIVEHHIDLRLETELKEILSDDHGRARAVITNTGEKIECQFVGLTAGVSPNIQFIKTSEACDIDTQKGILVNDYLETTAPDVYALGDCAQLMNPMEGRRPIEAIWYTGRMMGETVAHTICGKRTAYVPSLWFNSAKFLDIEYQVYGDVRANPPSNHAQLYWEHEEGRKSIRLVFDKETNAILGFNLMGVRYRHEVCEKWIEEDTSIEEVLQNLGLANFDPEFYDEYEAAVIEQYNRKFNKNLKLKQKRGLTGALRFLKNKFARQE